MAQYSTDWSGYSLNASPSDWTRRHNTGGGNPWIVESDAGSPTGRKLRFQIQGAAARRSLSWNAIDSDPDRANVEILILARGHVHHASGNDTSDPRTLARGSGGGGSETAYVHGQRFENTFALHLARYVNGSFTNMGSSSTVPPINEWWWYRVRLNGDQHMVRRWKYGDEEPGAWNLTATSNHIAGAGWVGLFSFGHWSYDIAFFSAGTNGDPAPMLGAPPTASEIAAAGTAPGEITISEVTPPTGHDTRELWVADSADNLPEGGPIGGATLLDDGDWSPFVEIGLGASHTRWYREYAENDEGVVASNLASATTDSDPVFSGTDGDPNDTTKWFKIWDTRSPWNRHPGDNELIAENRFLANVPFAVFGSWPALLARVPLGLGTGFNANSRVLLATRGDPWYYWRHRGARFGWGGVGVVGLGKYDDTAQSAHPVGSEPVGIFCGLYPEDIWDGPHGYVHGGKTLLRGKGSGRFQVIWLRGSNVPITLGSLFLPEMYVFCDREPRWNEPYDVELDVQVSGSGVSRVRAKVSGRDVPAPTLGGWHFDIEISHEFECSWAGPFNRHTGDVSWALQGYRKYLLFSAQRFGGEECDPPDLPPPGDPTEEPEAFPAEESLDPPPPVEGGAIFLKCPPPSIKIRILSAGIYRIEIRSVEGEDWEVIEESVEGSAEVIWPVSGDTDGTYLVLITDINTGAQTFVDLEIDKSLPANVVLSILPNLLVASRVEEEDCIPELRKGCWLTQTLNREDPSREYTIQKCVVKYQAVEDTSVIVRASPDGGDSFSREVRLSLSKTVDEASYDSPDGEATAWLDLTGEDLRVEVCFPEEEEGKLLLFQLIPVVVERLAGEYRDA